MVIYGRDSFIGLAKESTYGTYKAPTDYVRFQSAGMDYMRAILDDDSIISGDLVRDVGQIIEGDTTVTGAVTFPLIRRLPNTLFEALLGSATAGAGTAASKYAWTMADLAGDGWTLLQFAGTTGNDDQVVALLGAKVTAWTIRVPVSGVATLDTNWVGRSLDASQSKPSAMIPRTNFWAYQHASITVGGTSRRVKEVAVSVENSLSVDRRFLGSRDIAEPIDGDTRTITWDLTMEFDSTTELTQALGALSNQELVLTLSAGTGSGTDQFTITSPNCRLGETNPIPGVNTMGPLELSVQYMAYHSGTSQPITINRWVI